MGERGNGRYRYRGFRIDVLGGEPTLALVTDPLAPRHNFGGIVRRQAEEALCTALRVIDIYSRDEAADVAERFPV
jgi:hypothetical protein